MSGISNYTLNQKINAVLGKTSGLPSVINLDTTLTTGNNAGANDIDMNANDILQVNNIDLTTINGSAYPPVVASTPSGAIMSYAGSVAPSGWLICDGSAIATASYPDLFAVIGYDFGGAGANFNLPDLSQRVPIGVGGSFARLNIGGSPTHSLTIAEMPSHNHNVNDSGHFHSAISVAGSGGGTGVASWTVGGASAGNGGTFGTTGISTTGISIQNRGGGSPFNILQPYLVLYYIIKT